MKIIRTYDDYISCHNLDYSNIYYKVCQYIFHISIQNYYIWNIKKDWINLSPSHIIYEFIEVYHNSTLVIYTRCLIEGK